MVRLPLSAVTFCVYFVLYPKKNRNTSHSPPVPCVPFLSSSTLLVLVVLASKEQEHASCISRGGKSNICPRNGEGKESKDEGRTVVRSTKGDGQR